MSPTAQKRPFRPWMSNLVLAFYGACTIAIAWRFLLLRGRTSEFAVALAVCGLFTVWHWRQFYRRSYGQRLEGRALKALEKVLQRRDGSQMTTGVVLPHGGDADAVVVLAGVKFNLEIKAIESPGKVTARHAKQARDAGLALFSVPVIWLPRGCDVQEREKNNVRIFSGDAKSLVKYLESVK